MQLRFAGYNATLLLNENLVINGTLVPLGTILGAAIPGRSVWVPETVPDSLS